MNEQPNATQYIVHIDNFEGPLDLLWELIRKSKIDITQVSLAEITEQYCNYLKLMQSIQIPVAMDFIVMASELVYYKSKALLPGAEIEDEFFIPPLPPELIEKLLEYKKYQNAAKSLFNLYQLQQDAFPRPVVPSGNDDEVYVEVKLFDLLNAFVEVLESKKDAETQTIIFDEILVSDKMMLLVDKLRSKEQIEFSELFSATPSRMEVVVTLLALLELVRIGAAIVLQSAQFGAIYIFRKNLDKVDILH